MRIKILVIDDDATFSNHMEMFGDYLDWEVNLLDLNNLEEIEKSLLSGFDFVFLDGAIPNFISILTLLEKNELKNKVIFVSGKLNSHKLGAEYGFKLTYQKPVDLIKINDDLRRVDSESTIKLHSNASSNDSYISEKDILWKAFNKLAPAVTIHKKNNSIDPVFGNESSKEFPFSIPFNERQSVNLRLLKVDLDEKQRDNSRIRMSSREDWNSEINAWVYSRLYDSHHYYWLTRQVMQEEYLATPLSAHDSLPSFMGKVVIHLKKWGITRVRLYKVMKLYSDDMPERIKKSYLLKPLYESGGGFFVGQNWYAHKLVCKTNEEGSRHIIETLSENALNSNFYTLHHVNDEKNKDCFCPIIEWGSAGTRALIPIQGKNKNTSKVVVLGLLAIDQRIDHLPPKVVSPFSLVGDKSSGLAPLTIGEMEQMRGYFEQQLIPKLFTLLENEIEKKLRIWNTNISQVLKDNIESTKSTSVDSVLKSLITNEWCNISNIYHTEQSKSSEQELINWYFLRAEDYEQLHVISGIGDIASDRKKIIYFNNLPPFKEALDSDIGAGYIIQDFQKWRKENGSYSTNLYANNETRKEWLAKIGSWVGIHFKTHDRHYLMVVHAKEKNYFNDYRARLLKHAAQRLAPLLLWENAERAKELFNRAIVHELATPIQMIEHEYKTLSKKNKKIVEGIYASVKVLHSMVENIKILNGNYGWISKSGAISDKKSLDKPNLDTIIKKLHFLYVWAESQEINIVIDPAPNTERYNDLARRLTVKKEVASALIEILFNLLHNAIKYTAQESSNVFVSINHASSEGVLRVHISNNTSYAMSDIERSNIFLPYFRAKGVKQNSGGGLGLAVVSILCAEHGMRCEALKPKVQGDSFIQTFLLEVPVIGVE